jgi:hypothetical protein
LLIEAARLLDLGIDLLRRTGAAVSKNKNEGRGSVYNPWVGDSLKQTVCST